MALNNIQQTTLEYLSTDSSQRQSALNELIGDLFFRPGVPEEDSRAAITEFISEQRERRDFCNEGINRFALAVLGSVPNAGPKDTDLTVTLSIRVNHSVDTYPTFSDIVNKVIGAVRLLERDVPLSDDVQWKITDVIVSDWDYEDA
jgi:hypothetical protein